MESGEELPIAGTTAGRDGFRSKRIGGNPILMSLVQQHRQRGVSLHPGLQGSERLSNFFLNSPICMDLRCVAVFNDSLNGRDGTPDQQAKILYGADLALSA